MSTLTFYRQRRVDGGSRTGIDVDAEEVWQQFAEPPDSDADPALLWYVDVRCEGPAVPSGRDESRAWLLKQAPIIKQAFEQIADKLRAGYDGPWPYAFSIANGPPGVEMKIVCSSIKGLEVGELSKVLRETGRRWNPMLKQLTPVTTSVHEWPQSV